MFTERKYGDRLSHSRPNDLSADPAETVVEAETI